MSRVQKNLFADETLKKSSAVRRPSFSFTGLGLHTGKTYSVTVTTGRPEGSEGGATFRFHHEGVIYSAPAHWMRVSGTSRATALILRGPTRRRFQLHTVEHFLAAFWTSGRRDVTVDIRTDDEVGDAIELPCLDGSALDWARGFNELESERSVVERKAWKIIRSCEVADGARRVLLSPLTDPQDRGLSRFYCSTNFQGFWKQTAFYEMDWARPERTWTRFLETVAPARTFGFHSELEMLAKRGLARGASMENALLLDEDRVVNPEGLRLQNEIAAHKLLDAIGDLALTGAPLLGRIDAVEAGHSMHLRAIEEAFRTGALVKGVLEASGEFRPL